MHITINGQHDGMGSQIHSKYSGLAFAKCHNITYVHTPLKNVGHISNSKSNLDKFERFFNLFDSEMRIGIKFNCNRIVLINS